MATLRIPWLTDRARLRCQQQLQALLANEREQPYVGDILSSMAALRAQGTV